MSGSVRVAKWLLDHRANVNAGGGAYPTALSFAASETLEIVQVLVARGADVNRRHGYPPKDPLLLAHDWSKPEIEAFLRAHGALFPWELPDWIRGEQHRIEIARHLERNLVHLVPHSREKNDPVEVWIGPPTEDRRSVVIATSGVSEYAMSQSDSSAPGRVEMLFELPRDWPFTKEEIGEDRHRWPIDWLRTVTGRVMTGKVALDQGHTVATDDRSEPLGPGTRMSAILFLRELRSFGRLERSDGVEVTFLSLFPIYESELAFKEAHGVVALVKAFQSAGVSTRFDPQRPPVV
jgi:hypothetical protein